MTTLVDSIASTIFETEYAMRWTQAITNSAMSAIVERHRRNARMGIEATATFIESMDDGTCRIDTGSCDWLAGFLRDAALAPVSIHTSASVEPELKNATSAVQ